MISGAISIVSPCILSLFRADVSLRASGSPTHLFKFEDIYRALKAGQGVTFSAISFLCAGGRETSYSGLGGHIPSKYAHYYYETCVEYTRSVLAA